MRTTWLAVPFAVAALGLGACGGSDNSSKTGQKYPSNVEDTFLNACKVSSNGKEEACKCALRKLEDTLSYDDFKTADAAIRKGEKASSDTQKKITGAITTCT